MVILKWDVALGLAKIPVHQNITDILAWLQAIWFRYVHKVMERKFPSKKKYEVAYGYRLRHFRVL